MTDIFLAVCDVTLTLSPFCFDNFTEMAQQPYSANLLLFSFYEQHVFHIAFY
jgi:hypothetical protein